MDIMDNRRQFERFGSDMIFWIKARDAEGEDFQPFDIENISAGGILARTDAVFVSGSHVQLNFELPQYTDLIAAEAEVCHVEPGPDGLNRIGLKFVKVENLELDQLIQFLEDLFK